MVKVWLEEKYENLRPLGVVGARAGFNFGTSVWRRDMSRMGEYL